MAGGGAEQLAHDVVDEAKGVVPAILGAVDHHMHELAEGDPMTWVATVAVFMMVTIFACVLKFGRFPWSKR